MLLRVMGRAGWGCWAPLLQLPPGPTSSSSPPSASFLLSSLLPPCSVPSPLHLVSVFCLESRSLRLPATPLPIFLPFSTSVRFPVFSLPVFLKIYIGICRFVSLHGSPPLGCPLALSVSFPVVLSW